LGDITLNLAPHSWTKVPGDVSTGKQRLYSINSSLWPTQLGGCDIGSRGGLWNEASSGEVSFFINKHGGFCEFLDSSLVIWENGYNKDYRYIPVDSGCGR
jgi:hypothetical protein